MEHPTTLYIECDFAEFGQAHIAQWFNTLTLAVRSTVQRNSYWKQYRRAHPSGRKRCHAMPQLHGAVVSTAGAGGSVATKVARYYYSARGTVRLHRSPRGLSSVLFYFLFLFHFLFCLFDRRGWRAAWLEHDIQRTVVVVLADTVLRTIGSAANSAGGRC